MNTCPNCQNKIPEKAKFCPVCGSSFMEEIDHDLLMLQKVLEPEFKIDKKLAIGGMAKVYIGEQPSLDRKVVVKVMLEQYAKDKDVQERFLLEARTIAKVHHPNIIHVIHSGVSDSRPYFVMEYMEGGSLSDFLKSKKGETVFRFVDVLKFTEKILSGLQSAHEKGIVHRDIKPDNILLHSNDEPVIVDFGIAKILNSVAKTSAGTMIGTADYMSPEQCKGDPLIDGRSDIYSVGIMLYEMLVGETLFAGDNSFTIVNKHIAENIPSVTHKFSSLGHNETFIKELQPENLNHIQSILEKACAKQKEDRYQTADEFMLALKQLRHEIAAYNVVTETKQKFGLKLAVVIVSICALVGGSIGYYFFQKQKKANEAKLSVKEVKLGCWVSSIYGKASINEKSLVQGQEVVTNGWITTYNKTFADFQISDTTLEVIFGSKENTTFRFREKKEGKKHKIIFEVSKGEIIYDIRKIGPNQEIEIITPEIIGIVKGSDLSQKTETKFRVDVRDKVSSNIELIKGNVSIRPAIAEKFEESLKKSNWTEEEIAKSDYQPILEDLKGKTTKMSKPGDKASVSKRNIEKNWSELGLVKIATSTSHQTQNVKKELTDVSKKAKDFSFEFKMEQLSYEEFMKRRREADELVYISRSEIEKSKNIPELIRRKNKENEKVLLKRIGKIKRKEPNVLILKNGEKVAGLVYESKPGIYTVETVNGEVENYPRNKVESIEFFEQ